MTEHLPLPELEGPNGKAWRVFPNGVDPRVPGDVVQWMVEAKWAHPFWDSYWISLLNLTDLESTPLPEGSDLGPARIYLEGATHEIIVHALDPSLPRRIHGVPHYILPVNFAGQFICDSDEEAELRVTETVREIINGTLNPDIDAIQQWIDRYGDHMVRK